MPKSAKAAPNEIGTRSGNIEFTFEVGKDLEDMRHRFRDDIIYHCAKAGMQTQAHTALEVCRKKYKNEKTKTIGEMTNWGPNAGRQKTDALMKALAGLGNKEALEKLQAAHDVLSAEDI